MADPVSIASGIAGLISLAGQVSLACYQYGCAVKGAPKDIQDLQNEVTSLAGVLTSVQALVEAKDAGSSSSGQEKSQEVELGDPPPYEAQDHIDLAQIRGSVGDCQLVLEEVRSKLQRAHRDEDTRIQKNVRRFIWPLKQAETRTLLARLERNKATFVSALASTNVSLSAQVLNVAQDIKRELALDRWERQLERKRVEMRRLYGWLSPVDPAISHRAARKLHQPGTGEWLFREQHWQLWASGKEKLLWLRGIPGSGKTVLLSSLLEQCFAEPGEPGSVLLYYYLDFRKQESLKPEALLGTLLCQLCTQLRTIPPDVQSFIERHSQEGGRLTEPSYESLHEVLCSALSACKAATILIDGLDELPERSQLVGLCGGLTDRGGPPVRVLISSRDEYDIREGLERWRPVSIPVEAADDDVRTFISSSIDGNRKLSRLSPDLRNTIKRSLIERAHGMFRWVALQVQSLGALRTEKDIRRALTSLPKDLYETYERMCAAIQESDRAVASKALTCLSQAARPLFLSELAEAAIMEPDMQAMDQDARWQPEDLLEVLGSMIVYTAADNVVVLSHHSVKEYLASEVCRICTPDFHRTDPDREVWMARTCLTYLLMTDFAAGALYQANELAKRVDSYPFLAFAARYWPLYACNLLSTSSEVLSLACALLHPSRTPNFWAWLEAMICQGYFDYSDKAMRSQDLFHGFVMCGRYPRSLTPLYYAASYGLFEVAQYLLRSGVDIDEKGGIHGGTALHAAFWRGNFSIATLLLQYGASTNIADGNFCSIDMLYPQELLREMRNDDVAGTPPPLDFKGDAALRLTDTDPGDQHEKGLQAVAISGLATWNAKMWHAKSKASGAKFIASREGRQ